MLLTGCGFTGNKQQQPKPVGDAFEVFQDQFQGKKAGGSRVKGATAAGLPKTGLIKQTKPKAGVQNRCSLTGLVHKAPMQIHSRVIERADEGAAWVFQNAKDLWEHVAIRNANACYLF